MRKRSKMLSILLAAVMVTGLLSGCGTEKKSDAAEDSKQETVKDEKLSLETATAGETKQEEAVNEDAKSEDMEITMMHFNLEERRDEDAEYDAFYSRLEEYQKKHPEVTVNQSVMEVSDYQTKIQAQAAVEEMPDVFYVKGSWFNNFVSSGLLAPLDEAINGYEKKDSYRDGIFEAATVDKKIYGLPSQFSVTSLVFYNEKLWKEIGYDTFPDNWEDIYAAVEKFSEKGLTPIAFGNKDKWPAESCILSALGDRYTGTEWTSSIIAKDGKAKFTDPEFVSSLQHMQDMAQKGLFNKDFSTISTLQGIEYYCQGNAAATITGYWDITNILANATDEVKKNTKIAVLPPVEGGKGDAAMTSGGCGWYVGMSNNLSPEKKALIEEFLFEVYGYEYSKYVTENYGLVEACQTEAVDTSKFPALTQEYLKCLDSVNLTPIYDILMDGAVIETMNSGIQELMNGTKDAQTLAGEIQAAQDALTKK